MTNGSISHLPSTWRRSTIGELYDVIGGGTPSTAESSYWNGKTPWITSADINGVRDIDVSRYVSDKGIDNSTTNRVPPRTLLVVTRVGLGKIAISNKEMCFSQDLQGLIAPEALVLPEYALHYLSFELQKLKHEGRGTTISGITKKQLKDTSFPLAPRNEQRRIIAKVEELFSELDKGIEALTTARQQLKLYRLVVLHQSVCNDQGFPYSSMPLDKLIGPIEQGWSPKCDLNRAPDNGEWAIIKTTVVQPMTYLPNECKPFPEKLRPRPDIEIHDGDILMTRKGPRSRTGVVCYVKKARPHSMLCDTVYRFRAVEEHIDPEYLELALNSPLVVQEIDTRKSGISESGISLNHARIRSMHIPLPTDKALQRSIVQKARERLSVVEHNEALIEEQMQRIAVLRQSILKQAFSGQLVAQDATDEPASELLARIRAEREESEPKKKRNSKNGKKNAA